MISGVRVQRERLPAGAHDTTGAGRVERLVRSLIPGSSRAPRRRPAADAMVRQVGGPGDGTRRVPVLRLLCSVMVAAARPFSGPQGSPRPARSRCPRAPTPLRLVFRDFRIFRVFQFSEHPIGGRRDFPSGLRNTCSPAGVLNACPRHYSGWAGARQGLLHVGFARRPGNQDRGMPPEAEGRRLRG